MNRPLNYLVMSLTSRCNLHCCYCYQGSGKQGVDITEEILTEAMRLADTGERLLIQLTGGEPTLVPEKIEKVVQLSREMTVRPQLAIQTNGTLLTPELVDFFKEHEFQVGVSLDGPPEIQERLRGKCDDTLRGLKLLEEKGVAFRVTTVVNSENGSALDKLALLLSGFSYCRGIGLDLLVMKGRASGSMVFPASERQLRKGTTTLIQTLRGLNRRRRHPILLREMELLSRSRNTQPFCHGATGASLAVSPDGRLSPCGQTMGDARFDLGTVLEPDLTRTSSLINERLENEQCVGCGLNGHCPGECPSRLYYNNGEYKNHICHLYRQLDKIQRAHSSE